MEIIHLLRSINPRIRKSKNILTLTPFGVSVLILSLSLSVGGCLLMSTHNSTNWKSLLLSRRGGLT